MTEPMDDDRSFHEKYERIEIAPGRVVYRYVPRPIPGATVTELDVTVGPIDGEE